MLDVTDAASIEVAVESVEAAVGGAGLCGVVNNAGIGLSGVEEFIDLDDRTGHPARGDRPRHRATANEALPGRTYLAPGVNSS